MGSRVKFNLTDGATQTRPIRVAEKSPKDIFHLLFLVIVSL
jgi:hypothetical protein